MKILVPIDFSPDSEQALRYATALAKLIQHNKPDRDNASLELLILHMYHVPTGGKASFFAVSPLIEREEQVANDRLMQLVGTFPDIQSVPHRLMTKRALPHEGIQKTIEEEGVELVVMGGRGGNTTSMWLGGTTLEVMQYANCPVLAVPRTADVFHPQRISLATDLETSGNHSNLDFFVTLVKLWRAEVNIIHVHPNPTKVGLDQAQEALNLDRLLREVPHQYHFIEDTLPARGIEQHLLQSSADLLTVVPRYRSTLASLFHKSVTEQLTTAVSLPILSIHTD